MGKQGWVIPNLVFYRSILKKQTYNDRKGGDSSDIYKKYDSYRISIL